MKLMTLSAPPTASASHQDPGERACSSGENRQESRDKKPQTHLGVAAHQRSHDRTRQPCEGGPEGEGGAIHLPGVNAQDRGHVLLSITARAPRPKSVFRNT